MLLSTRCFLTAPSLCFPVSQPLSLFLPLSSSFTSTHFCAFFSFFRLLANKRFAQSRTTLRIRIVQPNVCYVIFSLTLATRFGRQMLRFNAHFLVPTHTHTASPFCSLPCCCSFFLSVCFVCRAVCFVCLRILATLCALLLRLLLCAQIAEYFYGISAV